MNSSELINELRGIGLSEKSAQVYAVVLELGVAYPSRIAQLTKLNRSTTYKILEELSIKGLINEIEKSKKLCYQIEKPSRLTSYSRGQIQLAEERFERTVKLLPEIEGLFALIPNRPKVRYFDGLSGVIAVYEDHISEADKYEMLGFSNVEELMKLLPKRFVAKYVKAKERLGIKTRGIFPSTKFSANYNRIIYRGIQNKFQVQSRFIPSESFPYRAEITMYGNNKVSIINFHENVLVGVIIEDVTISGMMRMIFELAWVSAGKSKNAPDGEPDGSNRASAQRNSSP